MTSGLPEHEVRLAQCFVSLADTLVADFDVVELLTRLTDSCVDLLGATAAGLLLVDQQGRLQLLASSSEETRLLELFQLQEEEGPCVDCVRDGQAVGADDLTVTPQPWPRFAAAAQACGYCSVLALPLRLRDEVIGSLNLFRDVPQPLSESDQEIAQALADVATIAILQQRSVSRSALLAEQLQQALDSRVVIEQAKGVLAEHGQQSMDAAFRALRRYARDQNLPLSAVAAAVVEGRLDLGRVSPAEQTLRP